MELLRFHAISSVFVTNPIAIAAQQGMAEGQFSVFRIYLNLCSILFLCGEGVLPELEEHLPEEIILSGWRLGEGTLLFLLFHEVSHGVWQRLKPPERQAFADQLRASGVIALDQHIKEHFCDTNALQYVDTSAQGAMVLATQTFFKASRL